ncbi:MAG: hypothetical protein AB1384_02395 [Actinomycetota bacterium]
MDPRELAEKIAYLIIRQGFTYDEDLMREFHVDDFELIKAKNVLCRYYGIAVEKWHKDGEENRQALFLTREFDGEGAEDLVRKVFHDPDFKTKRRIREDARKSELRGEVKELFNLLQDEWGGLLESS